MNIPHDSIAERVLLTTLCAPGCESTASECLQVLSESDFLVPAHKKLFHALQTVLSAGKEVSLVSLAEAHRHAGTPIDFGTLSELLQGEEVSRPMVLAETLRTYRKRRELLRIGTRILRGAEDESIPPALTIEGAGADLAALAHDTHHQNASKVADFSDEVLARLADRREGIHRVGTRIPGWSRTNGITGGLQPGQMIVLAARPGVGKTALALNWLHRVAQRVPVALFSLEMSREECVQRMLADLSGVDLRDQAAIRANWGAIGEAKRHLDGLPIWISDRAETTARGICAQVDRLLQLGPLGMIVVDYLQLVSSPEGDKKQEVHRLGDISRSMKLLAKDRKVPVLVLSQLNREVEKRSGGRPQLSDLRDSGAIEQDADIVLFIHKNGDSHELIFAKNRSGPQATVPLGWTPAVTRFVEIERETAPPQAEEWGDLL